MKNSAKLSIKGAGLKARLGITKPKEFRELIASGRLVRMYDTPYGSVGLYLDEHRVRDAGPKGLGEVCRWAGVPLPKIQRGRYCKYAMVQWNHMHRVDPSLDQTKYHGT